MKHIFRTEHKPLINGNSLSTSLRFCSCLKIQLTASPPPWGMPWTATTAVSNWPQTFLPKSAGKSGHYPWNPVCSRGPYIQISALVSLQLDRKPRNLMNFLGCVKGHQEDKEHFLLCFPEFSACLLPPHRQYHIGSYLLDNQCLWDWIALCPHPALINSAEAQDQKASNKPTLSTAVSPCDPFCSKKWDTVRLSQTWQLSPGSVAIAGSRSALPLLSGQACANSGPLKTPVPSDGAESTERFLP